MIDLLRSVAKKELVIVPKKTASAATRATAKWQEKAGLLAKAYKLRREITEEFSEACKIVGCSQAEAITQFMLIFNETAFDLKGSKTRLTDADIAPILESSSCGATSIFSKPVRTEVPAQPPQADDTKNQAPPKKPPKKRGRPKKVE